MTLLTNTTYFFRVHLMDRKQTLLTYHISLLFRRIQIVKQRRFIRIPSFNSRK